MGIDVSRLDSLAITFVIAGFIGSKLLYTLTRIKDIMADPSLVLSLSDGWVVWGGIIGGLIGGYIYCRTHKMNFWKQIDLIIPSVALAQGFGRIGCFFAGCCYGVETTSVLGVVFPEGSLAPAGIRLLPTQLICSVFDFALFFVLIYLVRKRKTYLRGSGNMVSGSLQLWPFCDRIFPRRSDPRRDQRSEHVTDHFADHGSCVHWPAGLFTQTPEETAE